MSSYYVNPLHPQIPSSHHSSHSALAGAVPRSGSSFLSPSRRRVPAPTYVPSSKWKSSMGKGVERPISFDLHGQPGGQGVPLRDLSARSASALAQMMHGAGDAVLAHSGLPRIELRVIWPGYNHVEWARSIELMSPQGHITRAQLGAQVAMNFGRYMEKTQYEGSTSNEWRIGPTGVTFQQLILVSLNPICEGVWQADIAIDMR